MSAEEVPWNNIADQSPGVEPDSYFFLSLVTLFNAMVKTLTLGLIDMDEIQAWVFTSLPRYDSST